jgi:hypothetical protein
MRSGQIVQGLCALTLGLLTACTNPFATGDPKVPGGPQVDYPQPTSPENVLEILSLALGAGGNPTYVERLAEEFRFEPDPVQMARQEFSGFPAEWTKAEESTFLAGLQSNADSVSIVWTNVFTLLVSEGSDVTADYEVYVRGRTGTETVYRGRAEMVMRQVAGDWIVSVWQDVVMNEETTTWGLLRAQLLASG